MKKLLALLFATLLCYSQVEASMYTNDGSANSRSSAMRDDDYSSESDGPLYYVPRSSSTLLERTNFGDSSSSDDGYMSDSGDEGDTSATKFIPIELPIDENEYLYNNVAQTPQMEPDSSTEQSISSDSDDDSLLDFSDTEVDVPLDKITFNTHGKLFIGGSPRNATIAGNTDGNTPDKMSCQQLYDTIKERLVAPNIKELFIANITDNYARLFWQVLDRVIQKSASRKISLTIRNASLGSNFDILKNLLISNKVDVKEIQDNSLTPEQIAWLQNYFSTK